MRFALIVFVLLMSAPVQDAGAIMDRAAAGGFSGVVLAARGGQTVFERAYGLADQPSGRRFTVDTPFSIASVTKQFTRAALLLLDQQGKLSLGDSVAKYIPELPADKAGITLRHLFDMQAGLHEYHDTGSDIPGDHQPMTQAEAIRVIGAQKPHFAPGAGRQYSNSGYTLLAIVIERVSGKPFDAFVRETLLSPAGMHATGFYGEARWKHVAARGSGPERYRDNDPGAWPAPQWTLIGSGGMVSTAGDLARWIRAIHSGRLLDAAHLRVMYPRAEWAFYAGGSSFGYETTILEFNDGADFVILHSSNGMGLGALAGDVAGAVRAEALPAAMKDALTRGRQVTTTAPQADGRGEVRLPGTPDTPAKKAAAALLAALRDGSAPVLTAFVNERMAPALRDEFPMAQHLEALGSMRADMRASGRIRIEPDGEFGATITFSGGAPVRVLLKVSAAPPHLIEAIELTRE